MKIRILFRVPKKPPQVPHFLRPLGVRMVHAHGPVHVLYFGLVAWEVSKWYAVAAALLAIIELARLIEGEHDK